MLYVFPAPVWENIKRIVNEKYKKEKNFLLL